MNEKKAKMLRKAAGYQPGELLKLPFPGIARVYRHPVPSTRTTIKTSYVKLPMDTGWTKVETKVERIVTDNRGRPIPVIESMAPGTVATKHDENGKPVEFNKHVLVRPKEALVPVTKPARLDPKSPKGVYRSLKRLANKGLINSLGMAIVEAYTTP